MLTQEEGRLRFLRRRHESPRRRFRRGVYLLPSLFTMGHMFCGYACVVYATRGEFETAAPFIGVAIVLDMLDGRIARMTGTASEFGVQFDSLCRASVPARRQRCAETCCAPEPAALEHDPEKAGPGLDPRWNRLSVKIMLKRTT